MKTKIALSLVAAVACIAAFAESLTCASPDGKNALSFALGENGEPTYSFAYRGRTVVEPSTLGFDIKALGKDAFDGRKPGELRTGFVLAGVERAKADETWKPVWGEESEIRDRHEEMLVKLVQKGTGRRMDLRFVEKKCFDLVREYAEKGLRVGKSSQRTRYFEIASGGGDGVMASCRRAGDATPCQAIRSLQGPPYWGSVAPRRTFAAIAQNQRKSGAREKSEWKMTF